MSRSSSSSLSPEQERMYASEKEENFRWILKLTTKKSSYVLSEKDLAPSELQNELSEIGQFAEVAHGSMDPERVWAHLSDLLDDGFPLHGYTFLEGSELIRAFKGTAAQLQGYVAFRPQTGQLIVSFSGTSNRMQAFNDTKAWKASYPLTPGENISAVSVHSGFWNMYNGVKAAAFHALEEAIRQRDVSEIILTGHSLGGAMTQLCVLDLLKPTQQVIRLPFGVRIKSVTFGAPRAGNAGLVTCWKSRVEAYQKLHGNASFTEWAVKAFNDGVPSMPSTVLGYRHFADNPYFLFRGRLYQIPLSEKEAVNFDVDPPTVAQEGSVVPAEFPLGGHNYYGRDMEKLQRQMKWATEVGLGSSENWRDALLQKIKEDEEKWKAKHTKSGSSSFSLFGSGSK
ncbi:hypothetical protein FRC04_002692 [Tulasnella sp. 424]|nr:hypothetical protein FRC04_002692 [Tulasnella sp. 424]KAG8974198.1 hypothetical protein FRC05_007774 [Tulasnella sp. 425]